ncbi:MAG: hypothetical protein ACI9WU_005323 [Myxococcota bacterium]
MPCHDTAGDVCRTVYLNREGVRLCPGADQAAANESSIVRYIKATQVDIPAYSGSHRGWTKFAACVAKAFAPFDVTVTDRRPPDSDHLMVAVGGGGSRRPWGPETSIPIITRPGWRRLAGSLLGRRW